MAKKRFYAVLEGRVDEPTIFPSWADAHPRVAGYSGESYKGFPTIEEAREWMAGKGVATPKEVVKNGAGEPTPKSKSGAFYAVADGRKPGIYDYWYGTQGAKELVNEFSGNCHKLFKTKGEAEAFIEDWKQTYADACADLYRNLVRKVLDTGWRPEDMKLRIADMKRIIEMDVDNTDLSAKMSSLKLDKKED